MATPSLEHTLLMIKCMERLYKIISVHLCSKGELLL